MNTQDLLFSVKQSAGKGEITAALAAITAAPPSGGQRRASLKIVLEAVEKIKADDKTKDQFLAEIVALCISIGDIEDTPRRALELIVGQSTVEPLAHTLEEAMRLRLTQG